jgi:hypothetical protein
MALFLGIQPCFLGFHVAVDGMRKVVFPVVETARKSLLSCVKQNFGKFD